MSVRPPHPRARALRITYTLLVAWFVLLSALAGVAAGDAGAAVLGLALFAPGFGIGALASDRAGLMPSGELGANRRRTAAAVTAIAALNAVATIVWLAATDPPVALVGVALLLVALGCLFTLLAQTLLRR